jgi:hypothetical protein
MMDWLAGGCELSGLWLIGSKRRLGFLLNIAGCSLWVAVSLRSEIYGLLLVVLPAIVVNARNYLAWRKM